LINKQSVDEERRKERIKEVQRKKKTKNLNRISLNPKPNSTLINRWKERRKGMSLKKQEKREECSR
jgi:hypothetical protein